MIVKRRVFIKTGMLLVPSIAFGQEFGVFNDLPYISSSASGTSYDPAITDWAARVVSNGGAAPSDATKSALNTFYLGLSSNSILSKMIAVCCFVPDNLIASITPLIKVAGNDPWTNTSFVGGDLTSAGLKGNGSTKYLNTGVVPNSAFASNQDIGLTLYNSSDNTDACEYDISATDNPATLTILSFYHSCGGVDYFDCNDTVQGRTSGADSAFLGYVSGNRTSNTAAAIYKANSSTAHTTVGSSVVSGGFRPSFALYAYASNRGGTLDGSLSAKRYSYVAIHLGLSSGESSAHYNLVQAMRTSLGGGFV